MTSCWFLQPVLLPLVVFLPGEPGDKVIWSGTSQQLLKTASLIEGKTISTLHDGQPGIYSSGESPTRDPNLLPGWYYNNAENNFINWQVYGDTAHVANSLVDFKGAYAVVTFRNTTSRPFFQYTEVTPG